VNQPGLYEVRDIDASGHKRDSYVVFDGRNKGKATLEEATILAADLSTASLKRTALKAMTRDRQKRRADRQRNRELCGWLLNASSCRSARAMYLMMAPANAGLSVKYMVFVCLFVFIL